MADVHNPKIRSKNMRAIRHQDTKIENELTHILSDLGFTFETQVKTLPGKPDFVIHNYRKIIFTHGCFWHQHDCHLFKIPATRTEFWLNKIGQNVLRDEHINKKLIDEGWKILIVWECAIKGRLKLSRQALSERIEEWICAASHCAEITISGIRFTPNVF